MRPGERKGVESRCASLIPTRSLWCNMSPGLCACSIEKPWCSERGVGADHCACFATRHKKTAQSNRYGDSIVLMADWYPHPEHGRSACRVRRWRWITPSHARPTVPRTQRACEGANLRAQMTRHPGLRAEGYICFASAPGTSAFRRLMDNVGLDGHARLCRVW